MKTRFAILLFFVVSGSLFANDLKFKHTSSSDVIIEHDYYKYSVSKTHKQVEWVSYELMREDMRSTTNDKVVIQPDPLLKEEVIGEKAIKKAKLVPAFLAPMGDMRFSVVAFEEACYESLLTPMLEGFVERSWKMVNQAVHSYVKSGDNLYVVNGVVFGKESIKGVNNPTHYYRILFDNTGEEKKMMAYLLPHEGGYKKLQNLIVSVDEIEKITGLDFFSDLPDELENKLEAEANKAAWVVD